MRTSFSSILFSLWLLFASVLASQEIHTSIDESCGCTVKYIVVEMPPQTASSVTKNTLPTGIVAAAQETASVKTHTRSIRSKTSQTIIHASSTAHHNTTATFVPKTPAKVDCSNPENAVPRKKIAMSYGDLSDDKIVEQNDDTSKPADKPSNGTFSTFNANKNTTAKAPKGSIDMDLVMNHPAVVLDYIDAITSVECTSDSIEVKFDKTGAFNNAVKTWLDTFILITSNMGNCKAANGQGFYLVDRVTADKDQRSITCHASEQKLEDIAETCEMSFNSIPATKLRKRLSLNPSLSLDFGAGLERDTILFSEEPFVSIKAEQAEFSSTISFSGRAKYNFWKFKMEHLYFDLNTRFSADVALSADVAAAWSRSILYDPDTLTFSVVEVPGILSLGPGIAFAVGVDVDTSAAVAVRAGAGISIPAGNVHLDALDGSKNSATGWEPQYTSYADISESVEVGLNASASLTVQLTFKLLGGLVDLSSGLTAKPEFVNKFSLDAVQSGHASNGGAGGSISTPPGECGVALKSDFVFDLDGFATRWVKGNLYHVEVPITDICYAF
ncbi:isoamyl alcohol [Fusarium langsethiae]|uniref:Isoamyl alcohol n=1 Tax=Fusarium langsethiae TaxID=179993 RepID=A0A0N1J283_FUSLA|nr:isoamyl alcohol [Fusarium langsethiae]GKU11714.1 unnamed protein product [Fusarium langsethiae]